VQALRGLPAVRLDHVLRLPQRRTPTYIKPMLHEPGRPPRELNRLDIKNRTPLPAAAEEGLIDALAALWPTLDALLVLDQVSEAECGVVTTCVRDRLAQLGAACPERLILADSRERIRAFVDMTLKPNVAECRGAVGDQADEATAAALLAQRARRTVYCTCGPRGIWVAEPGQAARLAPAPPVAGPIDTVGAGDSTSAGLACALTCGASPVEAAAFANLIASITIRQLGVTGTATPDQVRRALAGLP